MSDFDHAQELLDAWGKRITESGREPHRGILLGIIASDEHPNGEFLISGKGVSDDAEVIELLLAAVQVTCDRAGVKMGVMQLPPGFGGQG